MVDLDAGNRFINPEVFRARIATRRSYAFMRPIPEYKFATERGSGAAQWRELYHLPGGTARAGVSAGGRYGAGAVVCE